VGPTSGKLTRLLQHTPTGAIDLVRRSASRTDGATAIATAADVANCYRYFLGRAPDDRGYRGFLQNLTARPTTVDELVEMFLTSEEFQDRRHRLAEPAVAAPERVELNAGYHLYVRPDDTHVGAQLKRALAYEEKVSDRITELLTPGSVFVDVGASIGVFTIMAGRLVGPTGRVIAIEPGPQNRTLLLLNIATNGLDNVDVVWSAVSDDEGLVLYGQSGGNGFIQTFDGDVTKLTTLDLVESRSLDAILSGRGRIDVVKIDVEGAEGRVLRGARDLLRSRRSTVFFEFSPPALAARSGIEAVEVLATLMDYGYTFDVLLDSAEDLVDVSVYGIVEVFEASDDEHLNLVARPRP
jgi:FkbM family methyltransferase